jgi:hypothetical protein
MEQENQRWYQLCQLAVVEPDPEQLMELVTEVNRLLEAKESAPSRSTRHDFSMNSLKHRRVNATLNLLMRSLKLGVHGVDAIHFKGHSPRRARAHLQNPRICG